MKVTVVQSEIIWHDPAENISRVEAELATVNSTDLIVLPEMWFCGFTMKVESMAAHTPLALERMQQWAQKKEAVICGSMITRHQTTDFRNRLYFVSSKGILDTYDKKHLFSYAGEDRYFTPGNTKLDIRLGNLKVRANICYDLRFPVWSSNDTGYDVLLYSANWPDKRIEAWKALLIARAIENQCYVIGCNCVGQDAWGNTYEGHSAIIGPDGTVLKTLKGSGILEEELDKKALETFRKELPFLKDADAFKLS